MSLMQNDTQDETLLWNMASIGDAILIFQQQQSSKLENTTTDSIFLRERA